MITENNPAAIANGHQKNGINTPQQMINLVQVQTLSLNMNNAVTAQQNAYTVNAAVVSSICTRILSAGKLREPQPITP
jgi:hypothetical protein